MGYIVQLPPVMHASLRLLVCWIATLSLSTHAGNYEQSWFLVIWILRSPVPMSYRFREEDFPPLQRGDPSTSSPPDQGHWQATPQTLPPRRAQHQQGPVHTPCTQGKDQGHWQAIPKTFPPRRTQRQQRPVHTPHTQRKDQVSSSSAAGKPRKMVLERQELLAKVCI